MRPARRPVADDAAQAALFDLDDPAILDRSPTRRPNPTMTGTVTAAGPSGRGASRRGVRRQRRQVGAWLAQGLAYQAINDTAHTCTTDEFHTPDGTTIAADQIDEHLAGMLTRVLHGDGPPPDVQWPAARWQVVSWRGVDVSFVPGDDQSVHMRLTAGGANHVLVPVPAAWVDEPGRGRIRGEIADRVATAAARAADLIAAAHSLADRIRHADPSVQPAGTTDTHDVDTCPAASAAGVAFPHPSGPRSGRANVSGLDLVGDPSRPTATPRSRR